MFSLAKQLSLAPTNLLEDDLMLFTAQEEIQGAVECSKDLFVSQGSKAELNKLHLIEEETSIHTKGKIQRVFSRFFCCRKM